MKTLKALVCTLLLSFAFCANAEKLKMEIVSGGQSFNFVTSVYFDCNGSGFEGIQLNLLRHDPANKVKVYKVEPIYGVSTMMFCGDEEGEFIDQTSSNYQTNPGETVIFIMNEDTELVSTN